jgi:hypothetical protein
MQDELHGYRLLKTGNLSLLYRQGEIRQIRVGSIQVINALYGAVRDRNWGTVPIKVMEESIRQEKGLIQVDAALHYEEREISYRAEIQIKASPRELSFHFSGKALSPFLRNRIGICVLHPIKDCRGRAFGILHPDGSCSETRFPDQISPDQPAWNMAGIQWKAAGELDAELRFQGEVYEMEDQRNWTDASYKTYGTPLHLPFPVQVHTGDELEQRVQLKLGSTHPFPDSGREERIILTLNDDHPYPLPQVGVGCTTDSDPVSEEEAMLLKRISFHHMRADLRLEDPGWMKELDRMVAEQDLLGWPVELALHFGRNYREELEAFLQEQGRKGLQLSSILLFNREHMSDNALLEQLLPRLKEAFPQVPLGGGTNAYFAELNRSRLNALGLDFVTYSICPQVHAFDNLTLLENLEAQGDTVLRTRQLFHKAVHIGALTLKQRFNMVATHENKDSGPFPLTDPRQRSVLAAGWTLGSIRRLAMAGAGSLSYFETVGPRGLMERQKNFFKVYPVFHLLEEILKEHSIMPELHCSDPFSVEAFALRRPGSTTLLLVNLTEKEHNVDLDLSGNEALQTYILTEKGWKATGTGHAKGFQLKPAGMYKLKWKS